jgi:hypothetical protein
VVAARDIAREFLDKSPAGLVAQLLEMVQRLRLRCSRRG